MASYQSLSRKLIQSQSYNPYRIRYKTNYLIGHGNIPKFPSAKSYPLLLATIASLALISIITWNLYYSMTKLDKQAQRSYYFSQPQQITSNRSLIKSGPDANYNRVGRTKRLPQSLIIGARKCGTRALLKFLEINPSVRVVEREVHFFDKPDRYERGLSWYRDQMVESELNEITIEKSPSYFVTQGVADKVAAMNNSIKLIVILRNPIVRLISDFSQIVANKIELSATNDTSDTDIDEAWQEAAKLFQQHLFRRDGSLKDTWRAVQMGMYSKYLEKWLNVFPMNQIHFVDGEQLIKEPYKELQLVEEFLHLKPIIKQDDFIFDQRKGFYCIAIKQSDDLSITNNPHQRNPKIEAKCLSKHKGRRHIAVDKEIIDRLRQFYAPYNEYLFSLIGKQFDWSSQL